MSTKPLKPRDQVSIGKSESDTEKEFSKPKISIRKDARSNHGRQEGGAYEFSPKLSTHRSEMISNRKPLSILEKHKTSKNDSNNLSIGNDLASKNFEEKLKKNLIHLSSLQWKESVAGLNQIVQMSRTSPQTLATSLPLIYKGITTLINNSRPEASQAACQAANEIIKNTSSVYGIEFEDMILSLLRKTTDINKRLRKNATDALNSMAVHVPVLFTIKVLLNKGILSFNSATKTVVAKLLVREAKILGVNHEPTITEDIKIRLVNTAVLFFQDNCNETRMYGTKLILTLINHPDFNEIIQKKITIPMLKKVNKTMGTNVT